MGALEDITRKAYELAWGILSKESTLTIRFPKPGAESANILYGPTETEGYEEVVLEGCVGGWARDWLVPDGYTVKDKRSGKAIFHRGGFWVPDEDGSPQPITFERMRQLFAKPQVDVAFDGIAVNVTGVTKDTLADAIVVEFREVP